MATVIGLVFVGFVCYLFRDVLVAVAKGTAAIVAIVVCAYIALHTPVISQAMNDTWTQVQAMVPDFSGIGQGVSP